MLREIMIALIGSIIYLLPGVLLQQLLQIKKQTILLQIGLSIGYSVIIGTGVGLVLGFLGLFHRLAFLLTLIIISLSFFVILEAKRYKQQKKSKKKS